MREKWVVMGVRTTPEMNELVEDIKKGTLVEVSDGSFKDEFRTAV